MILENIFYTNIVNNRLSHYLKPRVNTSFDLPKSRAIHINMLNTISEENFESLSVLNKIPRDTMYVYNDVELLAPIGKMTKRYVNSIEYGSSLKKSFKHVQILKAGDKRRLQVKDLLVFNYKLLSEIVKYQVNKLNNYYTLYNALSEMINNINSVEKGSFENNIIMLDVPTIIPKRSDLRLLNHEVNTSTVAKLPTIDELLVLEIYKMFFVDSDSVFKKINPDRYDTTYFMIKSGDRFTIYKLKDMLSLSKKLGIVKGRFGGMSEVLAADTFLVSLLIFKKSLIIDIPVGLVDEDIDDNTISGNLDELFSELEDDIDIDEDVEEIPIASKKANTEFKKLNTDDVTIINAVIDSSTKDKKLTAKEATTLIDVVDTQTENKFIINGKEMKLSEILDYDNIDTSMGNRVMPDSKTVLDKEQLGDNNRSFDKEYLDKLYYKDLYNAIYSIQNRGVIITSHTVKVNKSFLGDSEEHTLELKPVDGRPSTVRFKLPIINKDSTYKMSGNKYLMRHQRMD